MGLVEMRKRRAGFGGWRREPSYPSASMTADVAGALFREMVKAEHPQTGETGTGWSYFLRYLKVMSARGYPVLDEGDLKQLAEAYSESAIIQTEPRRSSGDSSVWHWAGVALDAALHTYGYDNWVKSQKKENLLYKDWKEFFRAVLLVGIFHDILEDYAKKNQNVFAVVRNFGRYTEVHVNALSDSNPLGPKPLWFMRKSGIRKRNEEKDILEILVTLADKFRNCRDFNQEFNSHMSHGDHSDPDAYWKNFGGVSELNETMKSEHGRGAVNVLWYLNLAAGTSRERLQQLDKKHHFRGAWDLLEKLEKGIGSLDHTIELYYPGIDRRPPGLEDFVMPNAGVTPAP